jgi:hypothetical protein
MNFTALKPHIILSVIAHLFHDVYLNVCRRCTWVELSRRSFIKDVSCAKYSVY